MNNEHYHLSLIETITSLKLRMSYSKIYETYEISYKNVL